MFSIVWTFFRKLFFNLQLNITRKCYSIENKEMQYPLLFYLYCSQWMPFISIQTKDSKQLNERVYGSQKQGRKIQSFKLKITTFILSKIQVLLHYCIANCLILTDTLDQIIFIYIFIYYLIHMHIWIGWKILKVFKWI